MKTRRFLSWVAMATMVLSTGCSSDEVVNDYSPENAIQFGTYIGKNAGARGTALDNVVATGLPKQGFGVFAYYTDNEDFDAETSPLNFMNNTHVTSTDGNAWTYSPIKYWPNEATDKLSFFAYAPYAKTYQAPTAGNPILDFIVDNDVTNHIDLVVANDKHINLTKQAISENVKFTFAHVLSKVGFKVEAVIDEKNHQQDGEKPDEDNENKDYNDDATTVSVQEVELIGAFYNSGKINLNSSEWSNKVAAAETKYLLSSEDFDEVAKEVTIEPTQLNKSSEYMMLIPTETMSIKIRVKYTVTTTDTALPDEASVVVNDITSNDISFTFDQGKAYNFVLHLGLTSVKLNAIVNDWEEEDDVVVNVPINE